MKISRRQLRKIIREELLLEVGVATAGATTAVMAAPAAALSAASAARSAVGLAVIAPAILLAAIVTAGLAATTVDAQDLFDKLDPEIQDKLRKTHDSLKSTLSYLGKDAVEDALAAVINKILVQK
jgi:ATP-dependent protease HslVU (ClpYQ) peptidase subunit